MRIFLLKPIPTNLNLSFVRFRHISYVISILLTLFSLSQLVNHGLNFGIDFIGGLNIEAKLTPKPDITKIRSVISKIHEGEVIVQSLGNDELVSIRISKLSDQSQETALLAEIKNILEQDLHYQVDYRKIDIVGPQVGRHLVRSGLNAIVLSFAFIMLYIWIRFRWQFSLGIVIALLHDIVLALGFASFANLDFNLSSIAALLTVIGYSVNDSVVIYDRIRENLKKSSKKEIPQVINDSINETLPRTVLTVVTTLLANAVLILFGGEAIYSFAVLIFVGIIIGTYSSIFISAPILTLFKFKK